MRMEEDAMGNGQLGWLLTYKKVTAETVLLAMAYDIEKLHHKIKLERTGSHLFPMKKSV